MKPGRDGVVKPPSPHRCLDRDRTMISRRCDVCRLLLVIAQGGTKSAREET